MADYLVKAIYSLRPDSQFTISNDDYSTIVWQELDGLAPTQLEVNAAIEQVKSEEIAAQEAAVAAKQAAEAKLAALGLTSDDLKALGLN